MQQNGATLSNQTVQCQHCRAYAPLGYATLKTLKKQSKKCESCALIFQGIRSLSISGLDNFERLDWETPKQTYRVLKASLKGWPPDYFEFSKGSPSPYLQRLLASEFETLFDMFLWPKIKIHECLAGDEHRACKRAIAHLPTRILDLGPAPLIDLDTPTSSYEPLDRDLRLREGAEEVADYACLSHRWGSSDCAMLQLIRSNRARLMNKIRFLELPRTFQDAVVSCRILGIRYLWIDSLWYV